MGEGMQRLKLWGGGHLGAWRAAGGRVDLEMRQWTALGGQGIVHNAMVYLSCPYLTIVISPPMHKYIMP